MSVFFGAMPVTAQEDYETTRRAAEQGDAEAQRNLGSMYFEGRGVTEDAAEAVRWFRLAADQGDAEAQSNLGAAYVGGLGVPEDGVEAVRWLRRAADQGFTMAQFVLGLTYSQGAQGLAPDPAAADRWFRLAAAQDDAATQLNEIAEAVAIMYTVGLGVPQDDAEAARWNRLAAEQGDADALRNAPAAAEQGDADPLRNLRAAAEQGDAEAQNSLGFRYETGRDVARSNAEAVRWYRLAAEQGNVNAQFNLGMMYDTGRGVPQSNAEAVRWFRLAADQGHTRAQTQLESTEAALEAGAIGSDTVGLVHGLQLSEGAPRPGFMFSVMAGVIPTGDVNLTPAFEPGSTTYRAEVSQPLLTIRVHASVSVDITATGVTADGTALPIVNQSRLNGVNDYGNFLSVTFGDLAMGENRIQIVDYTIVVTRSAPD